MKWVLGSTPEANAKEPSLWQVPHRVFTVGTQAKLAAMGHCVLVMYCHTWRHKA